MLEYHHRVTIKITPVHQSQRRIFLNNEDPADVTIEETLIC